MSSVKPIQPEERERLPRRFWEKVIQDPSGCWLWTAAKTRGYGVFWWRGRQRQAHRVAYEEMFSPIGDGLHIDHLCRTPFCVNPFHLEPVTPAENARRGEGGCNNRDRQYCVNGHEFTPSNTAQRADGIRRCRKCEQKRKRRDRRRKSSANTFTRPDMSLAARFNRKWRQDGSGCWVWVAQIDRFGYGRIKADGAPKQAHRVAYELFRGPVPRGVCVLQTCGVSSCVNPDHLQLGALPGEDSDV